MRLFVAVELDPEVVAHAAAVMTELRRGIDPGVQVRFVEVEKMHLTVRFIGHVADDEVPRVLAALAPPLPIAPFEVTLADCGVFPRSGPPRVVWIGLADGLPGLQSMHDEFNRRLQPLGFEPETRPYRAHLTLARVKDVAGAGRRLRDQVRDLEPVPASCRIEAATLFQSQLSPHGSRYTSLLRIPCEG